MGFQAAKCPSCAGDIQVPTDRDVVKCMYCGVDVIVREAIHAVVGPAAGALTDLGRKAMEGANATDAFQLFSRALEADPKCIPALMGKGEAAGWCSTVQNMRFSEMATYFNDAIKLAAPEERDGLKRRAADQIRSISTVLWNQSIERLDKFVALDETWIEFIGQAQTLVQANELALVYDPKDRVLLENVVTICKNVLQGCTYTTFQGRAEVRSVGPEEKKQFTDWMEKATWRLRKLDPTFVPPELKPAKVPGCCVFIALVASVPIIIWLI